VEEVFDALARPVARVCLPDTPAPMSAPLERVYYVGTDDIVRAVRRLLAH